MKLAVSTRDLTVTVQPHGRVDHNGHRRSRTFVADDDPRPSWYAYGRELDGMVGVRSKRKKRRKVRR